MTPPTPLSAPVPTLYFAYGSNLSLSQMATRCPASTYHSLAVLHGYRWIINDRGYANVIPSSAPGKDNRGKEGEEREEEGEEEGDKVYGLLYSISASDEERLDRAEGVPEIYEKQILSVSALVSKKEGEEEEEEEHGDVKGGNREVDVLVYVDVKRVTEGTCKQEYVARMNRGIGDAVRKGMPGEYVRGVLRRWVPEGEVDEGEVGDPFLRG